MKQPPSIEQWMREAKALEQAGKIGMYLIHNGVVRRSARAEARENIPMPPVKGMCFSYDEGRLNEAIAAAYRMEGIFHIRVWLNEGELSVGDDIMYALIGGDTRPHTAAALEYLVGRIKYECVAEREIY